MGPLNHTRAVCSAGRSGTIQDAMMDDYKTLVKEQGIGEDKIITKPDQGNDDIDAQRGGGGGDTYSDKYCALSRMDYMIVSLCRWLCSRRHVRATACG